MQKVKFQGEEIAISGVLPVIGTKAPDFKLISPALEKVTLDSFKGQKILMNIFPSIDTPVCQSSCVEFENSLLDRDDVVLLNISVDLPFAHGRFMEELKMRKSNFASAFSGVEFKQQYGVEIVEGLLIKLFARAVIVLNEDHEIIYTELVDEITETPNFDKAIEALN